MVDAKRNKKNTRLNSRVASGELYYVDDLMLCSFFLTQIYWFFSFVGCSCRRRRHVAIFVSKCCSICIKFQFFIVFSGIMRDRVECCLPFAYEKCGKKHFAAFVDFRRMRRKPHRRTDDDPLSARVMVLMTADVNLPISGSHNQPLVRLQSVDINFWST